MNDIFDLASLDAGTIELDLESVEPAKAIESVASALSDQLAKSKVTLDIDAQPDIGAFEADPRRVRQILFHLLANAIGFSSPGQSVKIAVRREASDMVFTVSDEGRGIPADILSRIFERFESHTRGSNHRGVGLGLSMVKAFVELHKGHVTLDSEPGRGTIVTCRFPEPRARERCRSVRRPELANPGGLTDASFSRSRRDDLGHRPAGHPQHGAPGARTREGTRARHAGDADRRSRRRQDDLRARADPRDARRSRGRGPEPNLHAHAGL